MDSTKTTYASFPFEWTLKANSYQIRYRKAFNINQIDEIFCSIINAKGNEINFSEFGILLGFNLHDLAEKDILNNYFKGLTEYNLITINQEIIHLTNFGQEALQSKLKYKYYFGTTEVFENQTAKGESFDFSFQSVFDLENRLSYAKETVKKTFDDLELKQKIQFQLFGNDIYKGEIVDLIENPKINHKTQIFDVVVDGSEINYETKVVKVIENYLDISYKPITLQCDINIVDNALKFSFSKSGIDKPQIETLINLPENEKLKSELARKARYHHILSDKSCITAQDIETYIDLWNWKELAESQKVDWSDKTVFEFFRKYGDGGIWSAISLNAPIEKIKLVIQQYAEYWNWATLTERFDDDFIKEKIENYDWDFEELSCKQTDLVISLLANSNLKDRDWDWNYLSKNLPDEFIEKHIEDFPWDFFLITEVKGDILRNLFRKQDKVRYADILLSKPWNWNFISEKFDEQFLFKNIGLLAAKVKWNVILEKFFNNADISVKCLENEPFKLLLRQHLPESFVVAHQKYLWTLDLIDFFEEQNLIQWETKAYIQGFDTNENVAWNKTIFQKYHNRITTQSGFLNVSKQISNYNLIEEYENFTWNWEGISQNEALLSNSLFVKSAFTGKFSFSAKLKWSNILDQISNLEFVNKHLKDFYSFTINENHSLFWKKLTERENDKFIFENLQFPWDWSFITENSTEETILESFGNDELAEKWNWEVATKKLDKDTVLENIEDLAPFIDWEFVLNNIFNDEIVFDNLKLKVVYRLSKLQSEKRKSIWKFLTSKYPFPRIFDYVKKTFEVSTWEWDWDYISNYEHFPTDIASLNQFKEKINWTIFSESKSIKRKFEFNKTNWSYQEYFKYGLKYLRTFKNYWNWAKLTQNSNLHYNREFIRTFQDKWDWEYLSEFGGFLIQKKRDEENYLSALLSEFTSIHFEILSKRKDIVIDSKLIFDFRDKNWDWQVLSENEKAEISNQLILELKEKNWNWKAISKLKRIEFSNEMLFQLLEKDWDWAYLSENPNLGFDFEFIEKTKEKTWNWKTVSRHKTFLPTIEILTLTKDFDLDWVHLSQHSSLDPTKELLAKFENKWHWQSITESSQINFDDIDFIERFADKWNWHFICELSKLTLNNQILNQFKKYLDWNLISSNTNMDFTKKNIQDFKQFWNWTSLKQNKRIEELLGNYIEDEIENSPILSFIDRIDKQYSHWKGNIYHFAHIDNAVEIIKTRKIQSRNTATTKSDAAGNVVHRRGDAHDYARFYFRPNTPTQFYNEFLGKNTTDKFFDKARNLGFPKCPLPIFFRFSLKEVLYKNESKCCVSNGNMQKGATQFKAVDQMIDKFNFQYLYSVIGDGLENYMNYSQQEFLVKEELSFKDEELNDFEIVCPSEADRRLLVNLLGNEHKDIFSKIVVDRRYYNNENSRVRIEEEDSELHISTNFSGEGYFVLNGTSDIEKIEILFGDVTKTTKDKIIFKSNVSLGNVKQNIRLNFIDESNRNWFVYSN